MVRLRAMLSRLAAAVDARHAIGLGGIALVVIGVWGLLGWAWACIAAGAPFAAFYVWGEARAVAVSPGAPE